MQMLQADTDGRTVEHVKSEVRRDKILRNISASSLPENVTPYVKQATDKAASAWLNVMPIQKQNLNLNKQEFRDALRIRYNTKLANFTVEMCLWRNVLRGPCSHM